MLVGVPGLDVVGVVVGMVWEREGGATREEEEEEVGRVHCLVGDTGVVGSP